MRDQTDFEPWTTEKYRSPGLVRLERVVREYIVKDWKSFVRFVNLYGYEQAVTALERKRR